MLHMQSLYYADHKKCSYLKLGSTLYESQMCVRVGRRWLSSPPA